MTTLVVRIQSPVESALSVPRPVVKRCLNCIKYKCEKLKNEGNAVNAMSDTYIGTDCNEFSPEIVIVKNDPADLVNLKRYREIQA